MINFCTPERCGSPNPLRTAPGSDTGTACPNCRLDSLKTKSPSMHSPTRLKRRVGNCSAAAPPSVARSIIRAFFSPPARFLGFRRVIDISGDGANNRGRAAMLARDEAARDGISINGLPILALEPDLDRYYYDNVIGGPGAFMVPARSYDTFADAILKKLITEIAAAAPNTLKSMQLGIHLRR